MPCNFIALLSLDIQADFRGVKKESVFFAEFGYLSVQRKISVSSVSDYREFSYGGLNS